MKINANEIRAGNIIEHNKNLWIAIKCNTVKPGKGGAFNQVELKHLLYGTKLNERFRASESIEKVRIEQKDFTFLYKKDDVLIFMDTESYEQLELPQYFCKNYAFLKDEMRVTIEFYKKKAVRISLPNQITLTVTEADPTIKRQTAASSYKPAILENGIRILVPSFIQSGERILVDTQNITYLRRAE
ncbi:MAG: elongation factor P [Candidatus Tokpelaia sp. JSC161]|jgi:elongation factor P|nr:MAG: elongation factor P [Candidatus Tokpelaia sp. JSC161]